MRVADSPARARAFNRRRTFTPVSELLERRVLMARPAFATAGDLDPTFGTGGIASIDLGPGPSYVTDTALQPDSSVILAGRAGGNAEAIFIARFNPDGTRDRQFGGSADGSVLTQIPDAPRGQIVAGTTVLALAPDGTILVAATNTPSTPSFSDTGKVVLARFLPDGRPDTAFGTGGIVQTAVAGRGDVPTELRLRPDGRIVVVGFDTVGFQQQSRTKRNVFLLQYTPDGTLDPSFGDAGRVVTDLPESISEEPTSATLQPDGKVAVFVIQHTGALYNVNDRSRLIRYNADGTLDATFNSAIESLPPMAVIAVTSAGKLLTAGSDASGAGQGDLTLALLNADGTLDTSFGRRGTAQTRLAGYRDVELTPEGQILVLRATDVNGEDSWVLTGLNPDGTPDRRFGRGEPVVRRFDGGTPDRVQLHLAPDGRLVVFSTVYGETTTPEQLARFQGRTVQGSARLVRGTLTVRGSGAADTIAVTPMPPFDVPAGASIDVTLGGVAKRFDVGLVRRIVLSGGGGDDVLTVADDIRVPVTFLGGAGNDRLTSGGGADRLLGGAGNDTLLARDTSADILIGGAGTDQVEEDELDEGVTIEVRLP